ncbi:MAG TPA: phosphoadenylyl-sulfate reductase [Phycisphaerae bacterium]|jgi:phosphoadenosine phosphosulfate reductase
MNLTVLRQNGNGKVSESSTPIEIIDWMLERFAGRRMVATTAFGMEGCALLDMLAERVTRFTVVYLDTHFFFPETHELRRRLAQRYPQIEFVNRGTTLTAEQQAELYGERLWERDPDLCCKLRKVDPLVDALCGVDVWVTGLRRGQSSTRAGLEVVEWDWKYELLKVSPLAGWDRPQVWQYIREHGVPYNVLHERGYPSIGCMQCTQPVPGAGVQDYTRAGRWAGTGKTECGMHGYGI